MRPMFTVLRIQALAGSGNHNQREREAPNADESRTTENRFLVGAPESDNVVLVKELSAHSASVKMPFLALKCCYPPARNISGRGAEENEQPLKKMGNVIS